MKIYIDAQISMQKLIQKKINFNLKCMNRVNDTKLKNILINSLKLVAFIQNTIYNNITL